MLTRCPDCGVELPDAVYYHQQTCPLVRDISRQAAIDAEWFARNPECA